MQNKSAIWIFTALLGIACLYQLSFSWVTSSVEKRAKKEAQTKFQSVADSTSGEIPTERRDSFLLAFQDEYLKEKNSEIVYPVFGFTYLECKEKELSFGLDLQGGMNVTLEVSIPELVNNFASSKKKDPDFARAMATAIEMQKGSQDDFITLFEASWAKENPNKKLAAYFSNRDYKEKFPPTATNEEIISTLRGEAVAAIESTERILRTRIDKFGVASPSIQKQGFSGRILIELPGVKDKSRVRKMLQSTANLEFWETYNNHEVGDALQKINQFWKDKLYPNFDPLKDKGDDLLGEEIEETENDSLGLEDNSTTASLDSNEVNSDEDSLDLAEGDSLDPLNDSTAQQSLADLSDEDKEKLNPLLSLFRPAIYPNGSNGFEWEKGARLGACSIADTGKVYKYISDPRVQQYFPKGGRSLKLLWGNEPTPDGFISLYAIKKTGRNDKAPLTGDVIVDARQDFDQITGDVEVLMQMNNAGAKIWKEMTGKNVGKSVAVVLDDYVYSAPNVIGEIPSGNTSITMGGKGKSAIEDAKLLANILKAGSLPAPATIVEEAVVGPTLGAQNVRDGFWSFVIALALILAYMIFYYSKAGAISNVALVANLFFLIGSLASLQASLTLPGIAGIVLTIGMSVDANVLIYERIREELRAGKGAKQAIVDGYNKAYAAIIDANLTTLLTGVVLFVFGTGPIKGFATTLIIGIFTSLFSAIFITRLIFVALLEKKKVVTFSSKLTENAFKNINIGFVAKRKMYYIISAVIIAIGVASFVTKGLNFGVDFTGGRYYKVKFTDAPNIDDVKKELGTTFVTDGVKSIPEVKTIGASNILKITTNYMIEERGSEVASIIDGKLIEGLSKVESGIDLERNVIESKSVGATISDDIRVSAVWSVIFALIIIFLYIAFRFKKIQFGIGALIAMFHDVLVVLSLFSIFYGVLPFSLEIDQAFIAAILTVVGYSINDTVVVFDRIREYLGLHRKRDPKEIINMALNSTLSRTINTSLSTFVVLLMIFIFGGESIRGFTFALLIGVVVGTYSSLCIATPSVIDFTKDLEKLKN